MENTPNLTPEKNPTSQEMLVRSLKILNQGLREDNQSLRNQLSDLQEKKDRAVFILNLIKVVILGALSGIIIRAMYNLL